MARDVACCRLRPHVTTCDLGEVYCRAVTGSLPATMLERYARGLALPELPEVECLTRAVRLVLEGGRLKEAAFLRPDLRGPIPVGEFRRLLEGEIIGSVFRRSKYLLIQSTKGYGVFHLGMTGNILERPTATPSVAHTHAVFTVVRKSGEETYLHFVDARRFGRIGAVAGDSYEGHDYFVGLGPEPLDCPQLGTHLFQLSRGKSAPIKPFIMDAANVVGVGNIYASEALFRAGISPRRQAGQVSQQRYERLAEAIRVTLTAAIAAGGTTFRDFKNSDGNPGYFAVDLQVYGREGEPCRTCGRKIRQVRQSGRATFYCTLCQT